MNYQEAVQFLLSLNNLARKEYMNDYRACELYLKRLQFFLDLLGNPEKQIPHYIQVTGTSGKGSVCLMLSSILRAGGKKVGLLTSPHHSALTERWEINGREMSETELAGAVDLFKNKLEQYLRVSPYDPPSFFELLTALALYHFARKKIDWAVLEIGCGGRYDSTNVIPRKDVAVITNIGLDHTDILGDTKERIAYEKAGIIKKNCLVFTSESDKKILNIIQAECRKQKVMLEVVSCKPEALSNDLNGINFRLEKETYDLSCLGAHQIKNAILAIEVARALKIPKETIKSGLAKTKLPLRMEVISKKPLIILDGAHNPDKMATTIKAIRDVTKIIVQPTGAIHLTVGFSADKAIPAMVKQLARLKPATVACTRFTKNTLRQTANPQNLYRRFKKILPHAKIEIFLDPIEAFGWSVKQQKPNDLLLVTGSLYLSGEIRANLTPQSKSIMLKP